MYLHHIANKSPEWREGDKEKMLIFSGPQSGLKRGAD